MDLRPDMSIGERLKVARRFAQLTQERLADQAGVSADTVRKLEQGQRQSLRVSTANALARVLGIDTTALLLDEAPEDEPAENPRLRTIREALVPAADWAPAIDAAEETTPPDLGVLRHGVADAWGAYHAGDFAALGETLPGLLGEARVAAREYTNGKSAQAYGILAKTLQLGAHTMVQHQHEDLALLALDRAREATGRASDPLLAAMLTNSVSWIFLRTGRLDDSQRVAVATADGIEPKFRTSASGHVAVYGGLLLSGMTAAARHRHYGDARELLTVARAAAARIGDDSTDRWTTVFGPTSVAMQAVSVETAAGEWGEALRLARVVPMTGQTPTSWRARFLLDVAHAQAETYRDADAVETLRTARRLAPEWARRHGLARAVVRELMGRPQRPRGVLALADFLGIAY